ncbi:MAG: hypothetical protein M0P09_02955 [Acholeplasmataceae bacterium]|nr:hypothetical protein [Acholeplasmataceae bacterium]
MKKIKLLIVFVMMFMIFTACKIQGDRLHRGSSEMIFIDGAVAFIVKIDSLKETIADYYLEGAVPKTTYHATCIKALEGECETNLVVSRYGGTVNGKFIGVKNDFIGYPEFIEVDPKLKSSNLYEIGNYYLLILQPAQDDYETASFFSLNDYDPSHAWDDQPKNGQSRSIIRSFLNDMASFREYLQIKSIMADNGIASIVKIEGLNETIAGYYLDGTAPKTTFNATCVAQLEGECEQNLIISRYGGTVDGRFIGVKNEFSDDLEQIEIDSDLTSSNLFEVGNYYLVFLKENESEYQTRLLMKLKDYDAAFAWDKQPKEKTSYHTLLLIKHYLNTDVDSYEK